MKRTPLLRKSRLKARRSTKRRSERKRDTAYMLWVKTLPCLGCRAVSSDGFAFACGGVIEAHHAGKRAAGRKADDDTCISLCSRHHGDWHGATGAFWGWTREQRRSWADARITETQALWRAKTIAELPVIPF